MKRTQDEKTFGLSPLEIDECSEYIDEFLQALDLERRNRIRTRLLLEDKLLRLQAHYGADLTFTVTTGVRLNSAFVRIVYEADPYNPLVDSGDALDGWDLLLRSTLGSSPSYACSGRRNTLRVTFSNVRLTPAMALIASIVVGLLLGFSGNTIIPDPIQDEVTGVIFSPLLDVLGNILNVLAAPVVCFMTMTTMLDAGKVELQGGNRMRVTLRYFALSMLLSTVAVVIATSFFSILVGEDNVSSDLAKNIVQTVAKFIPTNVIDPFMTSNTPQLLALSFIVANALIVLGEATEHITRLVHEGHLVAMLITNWVGNLIPLFVVMLLALEIWTRDFEVLLHMWKPLLFGVVVSMTMIVIVVLYTSVRYQISPFKLVRKLWKPFFLTIVSGTLDTSYGEAHHACVNELGIDEGFTDVTLPQGLVLYMPASFMGTLAFTLFIAQVNGVNITFLWLVGAILLDVLLFVATPPVPGANLLAFIAIFATLGIPKGAFLDAMIFDIIFGIFANAANQGLLQMEMINQANGLGLLNKRILRS